MKKQQNFARTICRPLAFFYAMILIGLGTWGFLWSDSAQTIPLSAMIFAGLSIWHFVHTSVGQLGTKAYRPSRALDEWSLLQSDERQVVPVRLLTRVTGGISVIWSVLMLTMTLLAMLEFMPLAEIGSLVNLSFWQSFVIGWVHLALIASTMTYALSAWRTHYLA